MLPLLPRERDAERLLQRLPDGGESRLVGFLLDPGQGIAGVGCQEEGEVLGARELGPGQQHPLEELGEPRAVRARRGLRVRRRLPERLFPLGQLVPFTGDGLAVGSAGDELKGAEIGHQHLAIPGDELAYLLAFHRGDERCPHPLGLDHPAGGDGLDRPGGRLLPLARLELVGGIEAHVGDPGALVLRMGLAMHPGVEGAAELVEEFDQRGVE